MTIIKEKPIIEERPKREPETYTEKQLEAIKIDLIKEAETLFAGSTDAGLMVQNLPYWEQATSWLDLDSSGLPHTEITENADIRIPLIAAPDSDDEYRFDALIHWMQNAQYEWYVKKLCRF